MPKWGLSKSDYFFDRDKNVIAKGLSSIKYMSTKVAEELYDLAKRNRYEKFVDLLIDIDQKTCVDTRQLDILIKLDFFSDFGNQRELLRITEMFYGVFKKGQAKKISKDKVDGTPLEPVIKKYSVGVTKSGGVAKSYTLLDVQSILEEVEDLIKASNLNDLSDLIKIRNFVDIMGYIGYVSGKQEDRRKLYVLDVRPIHRKANGKQIGHSVFTKSIGSGKESRFTVWNSLYNQDPIHKDDIIVCKSYQRDGQWFQLTGYSKLY